MRNLVAPTVVLMLSLGLAACAVEEPGPPTEGVTQQAFSEAHCRRATPDVFHGGSVPVMVFRYPDGACGWLEFEFVGQLAFAPYNNLRCYKTYLAQIDNASSNLTFAEATALGVSALTGAACTNSGIAMQVHYTSLALVFVGGGVKYERTGWRELGLVDANGDPSGGVCMAKVELALPRPGLLERGFQFRIYVTARDGDGNTVDTWYNTRKS